jgi:hypothetical protein
MEKFLIYQELPILQIVMFLGMVMIGAVSPGWCMSLNGRLMRLNPNGMAKGMSSDVAL